MDETSKDETEQGPHQAPEQIHLPEGAAGRAFVGGQGFGHAGLNPLSGMNPSSLSPQSLPRSVQIAWNVANTGGLLFFGSWCLADKLTGHGQAVAAVLRALFG